MITKWIGADPSNYNSRYGNKVDKIILHWIVGTLESCDATFSNPARQASAHYGVGDSDIHQYVKEVDCAWHAGNLLVNRQSIGIENEGGPDIPITEVTYKTCAELVKDICNRYAIPLDREHIKGHREVSDKPTQCPGTLDIDKIIELAKGENQMSDSDNALEILKKFKSENDDLKGGNLEGAINAMVGWSNDFENKEKELIATKENLKISLKTNTTLLTKVSVLEKLRSLWQSKVDTANEKTIKAEDLANKNIKLYKNKNDEFNAVKYMTGRWNYLIKFCTLKFKGTPNDEYLKEEMSKVIKILNKEA